MARTTDLTLSELRRDLHEHAETGWTEFRTTALVAEELDERGFTLHLGPDAVNPESRMGVPPDDEVAAAVDRARSEGAPEAYLDRMDGITGLVAVKEYGDGPVVGLRIDMDALDRTEARDDDHRPAREGFASVHPNEMHACGHDGHTTIGVGVARTLDEEGGFDGTLKLFFQPAEEGSRGGKPMSETDHLADVDHFLAVHLGLDLETGTVIAGRERPLCNARLGVTFEGEPAHAGSHPEQGRNSLQALATAIANLYAIPRHADGSTRVNVGMVRSDNGQNVISEEASMRLELRGETGAVNEYMLDRAERIVESAAEMHDVACSVDPWGKSITFEPDESMVRLVSRTAAETDGVTDVIDRQESGGSEDASYLISRVQAEGGEATYVGVGASNPAGHHTAYFDIDEDALELGVDVVVNAFRAL
jgi:aminobenzoyl-glutamate utilization protein A